MPDESNRPITQMRVKYVCEVPEPPATCHDPGYYTPYAQYLEDEIAAIEKILAYLIIDHGEHKPIDTWLAKAEEWMGSDDWHINLPDEDQDRLAKIKGWSFD